MRLMMILTAVCIMATGCATVGGYQETMQSWVGADADRLVVAWGAPQSSYTLNSGDKLITYMWNGGAQGMTTYSPYSRTSMTTVGGIYCKTNFEVNQSNTITNFSFEGNACKAIPPADINRRKLADDNFVSPTRP